MMHSKLILTDSGGIQEEAPSLGKPVLLMRDETERPEILEAGMMEIVGTNSQNIIDSVSRLLTDNKKIKEMSKVSDIYGDGTAAQLILKIIIEGRI
jgi:UDP-N-acetylglucosamine 2-epimerase (non-hydrolysing)